MLTAIVMVCGFGLSAAQATGWDLYSDTWVATDALGRELPAPESCGPPRSGKCVGIFYWTWHTLHGKQGPYDNTKILAANPDNPQWGPLGAPHHWGEPELGYYISTDPYVIRKHASMLADAGVDVVIFDTTNPPFTFQESYRVLCAEYRKMREQGNRTPQIAFLAPFGDPTVVVQAVYEDLYSKGLYEELWFRWDGKPLIMADPAYIQDAAIKDFFTFRKPIPSYFTGPSGPDQWGWLEVFPQHAFRDKDGHIEQVTVGIAQNAVGSELSAMSHKDGARGRSWHNGVKDPDPNAVHYGHNVAEQWKRALELDPEFIFITGWNEWVAGRFNQWYKYTGQDSYYPDALFVDQYNHEYSRDIEPMKGGHTDSYYYQMVSCIRRFKGVRKLADPCVPAPITIDGSFADWVAVSPEYRDTIGDTMRRDHAGYGATHYADASGRNDIVLCKMACDRENLYCYARTAEPMTPSSDPNWMLLFLDTDCNARTGRHGYEILINAETPDADTTTVKRADADGSWRTIARVPYRVRGNELELRVPLSAMGYDAGVACSLNFHWADNIPHRDEVGGFALGCDNAPNRGFNYRWSASREN